MITVLDGPMGSLLAERGVPLPAPLWSASALESAPAMVAAIHREHAVAGATVHTACTFRTQRRHAGRRWRALVRRAVELARASVPAGQRVAGSMAPVEDCYRPDLSPGAGAEAEHAELAGALAAEGVDLLLCEAFPRVDEALAAVRAARSTGLPVWVSFTAGPFGGLLDVEEVRRGAGRAVELGAAAVLFNCTAATRTEPYVAALAGLGVPFGAYANAGAAEDGIAAVADGPVRYAALAARWLERGATLVGSCCGTGPAHVAAVSRLADARRPAIIGRTP